MAQNTNVSVAAGVWTQLTNSDVTELRAHNLGDFRVMLQATVGAVSPTDLLGAIFLLPQETLAADLTLAQLWPGVSGANRVYAYCDRDAEISVSHA